MSQNHVQTWEEASEWETAWHKNQQFNSYNEETKQYTYASRMGLDDYKVNYYGIIGWDFGDKTVIDIGGSGQSILLKSKAKKKVVVDPILPSDWMMLRYKEAGIEFIQAKGEDFIADETFDEALIYNVLQHVENPEKIVKNILGYSKVVRTFEYIEAGISPGHIHNLTEKDMNSWFEGVGKVERLSGKANGLVYYGVFKGDKYEK